MAASADSASGSKLHHDHDGQVLAMRQNLDQFIAEAMNSLISAILGYLDLPAAHIPIVISPYRSPPPIALSLALPIHNLAAPG